MEAVRTAIAVLGALAALVVALFTIKDFRVLRREGVNGPTEVVYAEKFANKAIILGSQLVYIVVGVSAMLAPAPIPPSLAAQVSESSATATMSVATYLNIAVQGSILVTSAMLLGSLWQLWSRKRLISALRAQPRHARNAADAQAQRDRIEADGIEARDLGRDTVARLKRSAIGDTEHIGREGRES